LISLKKYLYSGRAEGGNSAIRAVSLLIQGAGLHWINQNKTDFEGLRSDLTTLDDQLNPNTTEAELLAVVGEVIRVLETNSRRTSGKLNCQLTELQGIISTLASGMAKMVSGSETSLRKLHEIKSALGATDQIEDLRRIKINLAACLDSLGTEVDAQRKQSTLGIAVLNEGSLEFEKRRSLLQTKKLIDPITGLPTRAEAEIVLAQQAELDLPGVAVIFAVKRLKQVNTRFGYKTGDGLLERLATFLGSASPEDELYRWSGPALLSIIRRDVPFDKIRLDIRDLVGSMPEYEVTIGNRTALIVTSVGWAAFSVAAPIARFVAQLDNFVTSQISD